MRSVRCGDKSVVQVNPLWLSVLPSKSRDYMISGTMFKREQHKHYQALGILVYVTGGDLVATSGPCLALYLLRVINPKTYPRDEGVANNELWIPS